MADAIAGKSQSNSQELADLAESYRRKRQEIVEKNEEEIKSLKDAYKDKQEDVRANGDAAINHIRRSSKEKLENMQAAQEGLLQDETKKEVGQLKTMHARGGEQEELLKEKNENQEKYYGDLIQRARKEKTKTLAQEYNQTKHFQDEQASRRSDVEKATMADVTEVQKKGAIDKATILGSNREEITKINHEHRDELAKSEKELHHQVEAERLRTSSTIKRERELGDKAFTDDRNEQTEQISNMKSKLREEYVKTRDQGDKRVEGERKKEDVAIHKEVNRGTRQLETTRKHYDDEIKEVHARGRNEVDTQKDAYRGQLRKQDEFYKGEIEKNEAEHSATEQKEQEQFRDHLITQDEQNKKSMRTKDEEFQRSYKINEGVDRQALHEQHDRFVDAAIKQKRSLLERFGKYDDAKGDPFYKMHEFETRVAETPNFYILKTKVPQYEKHNVEVLVKNDHVIVTGQRAFEEKADHNGRKVSTNSAESFREEIPLGHPALPKEVTKSYEDGHIVVRIPKLPIS